MYKKVQTHIRFSLLILLSCIFTTGPYSQWVVIDSLHSFVPDIGTSGGNLYVCTATAGFYVSHDSGATFVQADSDLLNLNTRVILPKNSILIPGTNNQGFHSTRMTLIKRFNTDLLYLLQEDHMLFL
jgi:hypothetical protein